MDHQHMLDWTKENHRDAPERKLPLEGNQQQSRKMQEPENRQVEHIPPEDQKEKNEGKGTSSGEQITIRGASESTLMPGILERKELVRLFEEIIARNFPNLMKNDLHIYIT